MGAVMSASLDTPPLSERDLVSRSLAWPIAACLPVLLAAPWLLLGRGAGMPGEVWTLRYLLLFLLLACATTTDLLRRRIYNWTVYVVQL
jgi:hypothetical protein